MGLRQLVKDQGEIPGRDTLMPFGSVPVETVKQPVEILIFADTSGGVSYFISNGRPVAIYSTRL